MFCAPDIPFFGPNLHVFGVCTGGSVDEVHRNRAQVPVSKYLFGLISSLHNYFDYRVCLSGVRPSGVRHKIFFSLKSSPDSWGQPPGLNPGTSGASSPSGGASKGPKGPF